MCYFVGLTTLLVLVVAILVLVGALLWTQVLALFCDVRARAPINGPLPR